MDVVWTEKAERTYLKIYEYLVENWSLIIAKKFDEEVRKVIDLISKNPHLGKYNREFDFSSIIVVKQITLQFIQYNLLKTISFGTRSSPPRFSNCKSPSSVIKTALEEIPFLSFNFI